MAEIDWEHFAQSAQRTVTQAKAAALQRGVSSEREAQLSAEASLRGLYGLLVDKGLIDRDELTAWRLTALATLWEAAEPTPLRPRPPQIVALTNGPTK